MKTNRNILTVCPDCREIMSGRIGKHGEYLHCPRCNRAVTHEFMKTLRIKDTNQKRVNLKDDEGRVIAVNKDSLYPPLSETPDEYMVCLGRFTYFRGKITDDPVNVSDEQIRQSIS